MTIRLDLWLIAEAHRIELVYDFAGVLHRLDFILETPRRNQGPKLTICIYVDGLRATRLLPNLVDIATVANVCTASADTNNVIGHSDVEAGSTAQGSIVETAREVTQGIKAIGRVVIAGLVASERLKTIGRVAAAGGGL